MLAIDSEYLIKEWAVIAQLVQRLARLHSPWIESQCGRDFPHLSTLALGPTQFPIQRYRVFPGVKQPGRVFNNPPHLVPGLKKE